jgi:hypothetical protein
MAKFNHAMNLTLKTCTPMQNFLTFCSKCRYGSRPIGLTIFDTLGHELKDVGDHCDLVHWRHINGLSLFMVVI